MPHASPFLTRIVVVLCNFNPHTDDYRGHTSCISEVERYEKRASTKKNGKVSPQQQWMDLIQSSEHEAPGDLKHYMQTIAGLDNVPRKEKQFRNFATNSLNLRGQRNSETVVTSIWNYLKELREKQLEERAKEEAAKSKPQRLQEETKKEEADEWLSKSERKESVTKATAPDQKTVKKAMKKILKKAKDHTMPMKHLRKAVLTHLGAPKSSKSQVKELVRLTVKDAKKKIFLVDGKTVTLKIDH